ncbi:neurotactin isoform X2 [Nomia melanderi]|uniref:neurotactin isoform X2 n=1 Tax=Nomia melanderi TaxID=2448451 RepID=UPI0013045084|nr:neurotactin isoform X2 [Nomia melanderi]
MSQGDQEKSLDKKEIAEEEREKMLNAENTKHTVSSTAPDSESEEQKPKKKIPIGGIKMPGFCRTKSKEPCKDGEVELGTTGAAGLASVETLDDGAGDKNPVGTEDGMETVRLDGDAPDGIESPKQHFLVSCISAARRNLFVSVATLCILISVIIIVCVACIGPRKATTQPIKDGNYIKTVTSCGPVQGVSEDGAFAFRGIPYAIPPVENRRWQPAEAIQKIEHCWTNTYLAHNSTEVCSQFDGSGGVIGAEDCLYLDVFTPEVKYDSPLPVVVMIGAETLSGGSPGIMQPSAKLARVRDMVFVRPNFRLGVFGFLAAEPLSRATHPPTSGNYGLSDIIVALHWVQLNIEHFGGDKKSVTLWGHRAGGTLVTTLVGIRRAKDLFSRVWISSGSAIFPGRELEDSEKLSEQFLNSIKCSDAACLRSKSVDELMDSVPDTWHLGNTGLPEAREATSRDRRHEWLVLDRAILQEPVGRIWAGDEFSVKIVMGTTAHAGVPLKYLNSNITLNSTQVEKLVRESLLGTSDLADEALKRYNATLKGLVSMISDIRVICPLLTVARMKTNIPFYVATQPRGQFADPDSDAAAILGSFAARTPAEKRHVSAMQQLFNHYVWHGEVGQADSNGVKRVFIIGQDKLAQQDYPNCDVWIGENIVPSYGRVD